MSIIESISQAFSSLWANKMRSLLTMLGIIIGIGSVIAILTLGSSLSGSVNSSLSGLGVNNITLSLQSKKNEGSAASRMRMMVGGGGSSQIASEHLITPAMLDELKARYPSEIKGISMTDSVGSGRTAQGKLYANLSLSGVNSSYLDANSVTMLKGRFLNQQDSKGAKKVAVVSDKLVSNMFPREDPLGKQITITAGSHTGVYAIVGVYEYTSNNPGGSTASDKDLSTTVYIPLTTANNISRRTGYSSVTIVTTDGADSVAFSSVAKGFFNKYYAKDEEYGVQLTSMESLMNTVSGIMGNIQMAIAAIAAISLIVGGIGVMNIMLVSITERTREIGTRKAIGATNGEIRIQFVVEAVIICLIGGVIGILLGIILGIIGASLLGTHASPSFSTIILATGFSMAVGVFFGYYPANKAAKLNPIDALRYE